MHENVITSLTAIMVLISILLLSYMLIKAIIRKIKLSFSMKKIDRMTGEQFEKYLKEIFSVSGYKVRLTPKSNDYGGDLLLINRKTKERLIVQAKRYNTAVGVAAVQEVLGAIKYYDADKALVVTNAAFTRNAIQLAKCNNVELYDRAWLYKAINQKIALLHNHHAQPLQKEVTIVFQRKVLVPEGVSEEYITELLEEALTDEKYQIIPEEALQ